MSSKDQESQSRYCDIVAKDDVISGVVRPLPMVELSGWFVSGNLSRMSFHAIAADAFEVNNSLAVSHR